MKDTRGRELPTGWVDAGRANDLAEAVKQIVPDADIAKRIIQQARKDAGNFKKSGWPPDRVLVALCLEIAMVAHHCEMDHRALARAVEQWLPKLYEAYGRHFMERHAVAQRTRDATEGIIVPASRGGVH